MSDSVRRIRRALVPLAAWRERRLASLRRRLDARKGGALAVVDAWEAAGDTAARVGPLVREGRLVRLRAHVPANRAAFQRWYADPEIVRLLRHDQTPLDQAQSRAYFDTIILPLSARDYAYAIHEVGTDALIGTSALTEVLPDSDSALFRIVIGEKDRWGRGYGTEATALVAWEAFARHRLARVRLEVFRHNDRAIRVYQRVGFRFVGEHVEWVGPGRSELHVVEMALDRDEFFALQAAEGASPPSTEVGVD